MSKDGNEEVVGTEEVETTNTTFVVVVKKGDNVIALETNGPRESSLIRRYNEAAGLIEGKEDKKSDVAYIGGLVVRTEDVLAIHTKEEGEVDAELVLINGITVPLYQKGGRVETAYEKFIESNETAPTYVSKTFVTPAIKEFIVALNH